jgi:hypothetical protein
VLIAVLFNKTSWLGVSVYGDISIEFSRGHYQRVSTRQGGSGYRILGMMDDDEIFD